MCGNWHIFYKILAVYKNVVLSKSNTHNVSMNMNIIEQQKNTEARFLQWCVAGSRVFGRAVVCRLLNLLAIAMFAPMSFSAQAVTVEFNRTGGSNTTNGLHVYVEDTTKIQVLRANGTGQVFSPTATPPSNNLDNGIFIRANGSLYGPSHSVQGGFTPSGGNYSTSTISAVTPASSSNGVQQSATANFGINSGPQVTVVWRYTTPLDFLTAEVTLVIPPGYAVSANNPVRYYHVVDTFLGGSDSGCGVRFVDNSNHVVVGTYPPPNGTNCPSSSSIPNGVTIIESFRERSGRSFSNYCAAFWSSFFNNGNPQCSIRQNNPLSNTVVTTFQDTGIGIEYDFTASGVYTFSYDFVIGSSSVPAYDHIEIQHRGQATLCPEPIQVLACTSSTVPCPAANIVNTGTISGNVSIAPAAPAVTLTPSAFSIGGGATGGSTESITLQGSAPGGVYALGAANISPAPLNGTRCWNGSSSSCTITVSNTPCANAFECLQSGDVYKNLKTENGRNRLLTKLTGTLFDIDVVAIDSNGNISTNYTSNNVRVELFDATNLNPPSCPATITPVATVLSNFSSGNKGIAKVSFNLDKAYSNLRCRVTDGAAVPAISGCSSDGFTVRPVSFTTITSNSANADLNGTSDLSTPIFAAGISPFDLTYTTGTVGYNGTPQINSASITWPNGPTGAQVGNIAGTFLAANPNNGNGQGNNFTYDEVGYFLLRAGGVYDDTFAEPSGDINNKDCVMGASNNEVDGNGLYGCNIGNKDDTSYFGRFVPDHFTLASGAVQAVCRNGVTNIFSYMSQIGIDSLVNATIEARNASNNRTKNYTGKFAKATVAPQLENANSGNPISNTRLHSPSGSWKDGVYTFSSGAFDRQANGLPDGPYDLLDIGLMIGSEPDGVLLQNLDMNASDTACTASNTSTCNAKKIGTTSVRYGRVALTNAFGSEVLPLPIPLRLEYWAGANLGWQRNNNDICTSFTANQFAFSFPAGTAAKPNNLAACETTISLAGTPPNQTVRLSAPGVGNTGWADLTLNLAATASGNACIASAPGTAATANQPALQFNWLGTGNQNPRARATFGVYKNADQFIYSRELH